MANPITIYQNQSIVFTSTTSGGQLPYDYLWSFNGGDISSSTGATALVSYVNPGNYSATLTVTDSNNLTNFYTENNFITVNPAEVTASFTKSSSNILMSTAINFTDTSTGIPDNPNSWVWDIGGQGYTAQNVSLSSGYSDWILLPGSSYTDVPGHALTLTAQLEASTLLASDVDSQNFIVNKLGPTETIAVNLNLSNYLANVTFSDTGYTTSFLGLPGDYFVYEIVISSANSYFHSTQESAFITCTGLGNAFISGNGVSSISGQIVIDPVLYGYGDPMIEDGKYIIPGYATSIYYADDGYLTSIYNTYGISSDTLAQIVFNRYPHVNSLQGAISGFLYQPNSSGNKYNPIVPSPTYMTNNGGTGLVYTMRLGVIISGTPTLMLVQFNANGGVGNEPGGAGEFYVMQDIGPDKGVASQINDVIISTLGSTGSIEAFADQTYSGPFGNSSDYYGLQIVAKTPSVTSVAISDNSALINPSLTTGAVLRFGVGSSYTGDSCTGVATDLILNTYVSSGTEVEYGGSIFQ